MTSDATASNGRLERSNVDIDATIARGHFVATKLKPLIADVLASLEVIFVAMPGTYDVHVILIEALSHEETCIVDHILDLRHANAFACRTALMRAQIAIGEVLASVEENAHFYGLVLEDLD
jgi:hypothetical protein